MSVARESPDILKNLADLREESLTIIALFTGVAGFIWYVWVGHPAVSGPAVPGSLVGVGSMALTSGAWSCNFGCPWCQNYALSKAAPREEMYLSPADFVTTALVQGCQGTSISLNEPTLALEWALEVFSLAREHGLYNTYVTNGYMTPEALRLLVATGLDALNVDIKGDAQAVRQYCQGIDVDKVWATCCLARDLNMHIELTTLVISGVNDQNAVLRAIAGRIVTTLGTHVPWHVTAYFPAYHFHAPPTPVATLERAWHIGKAAGLAFVYVGNVPGHVWGNTLCPECGTLLIARHGLRVITVHLEHGACPRCGQKIPGVWESSRTPESSSNALSG